MDTPRHCVAISHVLCRDRHSLRPDGYHRGANPMLHEERPMTTDSNADDAVEITSSGNTITVAGDIDALSAPQVTEAVVAVPGDVTLDLSGVHFVDSSALRVLVEVHQTIEGRGDRLTIARPSLPVRRVLELSSLDGYFHIDAG